MNNNVSALNDILFEQLERLMDDDGLKNDKAFQREMERAKAVSDVARNIIQNHRNVLTASKMAHNREATASDLKVLGIEHKNE